MRKSDVNWRGAVESLDIQLVLKRTFTSVPLHTIWNAYHTNQLPMQVSDENWTVVVTKSLRKTHSKCSKWPPRVSLHISHRRRNDWRTLSKIPGGVFILSAATTILATRSSAESTGISYTKDFMCPQKKKTSGLTSGERGGQATGPPRPIHRERYVAFKKCRRYAT
ncbi:hypothetical protein AVEN_4999-1 [Araneus ventricosus]|uniref:Uncharacterized protein n=1 Tax=Araneus ventricosus TaxID=182803 RepID=A0A4Y2I8Q3_ARAVE|nr:hypothetical protein AVEN_4999-1 [Araneus ventricosus]